MKYRVIREFADSQDNYYVYNVGDDFPHIGAKVSEERIKQLSTNMNALHEILIEAVEEKSENAEEKPKRVRKAKQV